MRFIRFSANGGQSPVNGGPRGVLDGALPAIITHGRLPSQRHAAFARSRPGNDDAGIRRLEIGCGHPTLRAVTAMDFPATDSKSVNGLFMGPMFS